MIEIPATVGFHQQSFTLSNNILKILNKKPMNKLRLIGVLDRLNLINKVWLSPETSNSKSMIKLTKCLMKKDYKFINMFFHSNSLQKGFSPYVKTEADECQFIQRIREFLAFTRDAGIESIILSETMKLI